MQLTIKIKCWSGRFGQFSHNCINNNSVTLGFQIPSKVSKLKTDYSHTFLIVVKSMYNGRKVLKL